MFRTLKWVALLAPIAVLARPAHAQTAVVADAPPQSSLTRRSLSGPRFGFTVFTGEIAKLRQRGGLEPIMTQFGWQFEKGLVSQESGAEALTELVFLVGGVEQGELNLTLSWMAGYRGPSGLEIGAGPAVSANKDSPKLNTSMILAVGATPPVGTIRIPLHMAVAMSRGGPRFTTLVGWIVD